MRVRIMVMVRVRIMVMVRVRVRVRLRTRMRVRVRVQRRRRRWPRACSYWRLYLLCISSTSPLISHLHLPYISLISQLP